MIGARTKTAIRVLCRSPRRASSPTSPLSRRAENKGGRGNKGDRNRFADPDRLTISQFLSPSLSLRRSGGTPDSPSMYLAFHHPPPPESLRQGADRPRSAVEGPTHPGRRAAAQPAPSVRPSGPCTSLSKTRPEIAARARNPERGWHPIPLRVPLPLCS